MKKRFAVLLLFALIAVVFAAHAADNNIVIYPEGMAFDQKDAVKMKKLVNDLRADNKVNKLVWDDALERTAQQRAEESAFYYSSSTRPNLSASATAFPSGYEECETKVFVTDSLITAEAMFGKWEKDTEYKTRQLLLDKKFDCFAVGHAIYNGYHYWALCLAHTPAASKAGRSPIAYGFPVEISPTLVESRFLKSPDKYLEIGDPVKLVLCFTTGKNSWPNDTVFVYKPYTGINWEIKDGADKASLEFDDAHKTAYIQGMKAGTVKLSAEVFGKTVKPEITVVSSSVTAGGGVYSLNHEKQTAELQKPEKTSVKNLKIPDTVKANGITYKVTAVAASACKGLEKLAALTIGKNVVSIGAEAFSGCKALKTITIKTSKLKADTVGDNAFTGIYKKATVKCPSKKLKDYKKFLLKKGVPSGAKFK